MLRPCDALSADRTRPLSGEESTGSEFKYLARLLLTAKCASPDNSGMRRSRRMKIGRFFNARSAHAPNLALASATEWILIANSFEPENGLNKAGIRVIF
jgi:hypothetical protein